MSTPKKSLPPRRKRDPRSMLRDSDSDSPKGRSFHAARSAVGYSRKHGSSHAARREKDEEVVELTPDMLAQLMGSLGVAQDQPDADGGVGPREVVFASSAANRQVLDEDWRVNVVQSKQSCVCKIISQIVDFDFEMPFKSADSASAIGTGFFVDVASAGGSEETAKRGKFIVTNAHVVDSAVKVWITIPATGEERWDVEVCGVCFDIDLAVLRVLDDSIPVEETLRLGDSNKVRVGQSVIALGHPLGMNSLKLTEGVISGREEGLLQTDTALNPGNSGGPMLNREGDVIGVNVAIVDSAQSVGFAIPSFHLHELFDALARKKSKGKKIIFKPVLGCIFTHASKALLAFTGVDDPKVTGSYVSEVLPGFPMANAGIKEGDILTSFGGYDVDNYGDCAVPWSQAKAPLGSVVGLLTFDGEPEIEYCRNGECMKATLSFEDPNHKGRPLMPAVREMHPPYENIDYEVLFGLVVMPLTVNHIEAFHEEGGNMSVLRSLTPIIVNPGEANKPRLVVSAVIGGSLISRVDVIEAGAVLEQINGQPVRTLDEYRAALLKPIIRRKRAFLTISTSDKLFVCVQISDGLKEEEELASTFGYRVSDVAFKLLETEEIIEHEFNGDEKAANSLARHLSHADRERSGLSPRMEKRGGLSPRIEKKSLKKRSHEKAAK